MLRLLLLKALCFSLLAQQQGRVYLISLDGLGFEAFSEDPAAQELRTMHKLAAEGIYAPMQSAFPSLTAPAHASLFTGVYGDRNGITANQIPLEFDRRVNGFRGEYLRATFQMVPKDSGSGQSISDALKAATVPGEGMSFTVSGMKVIIAGGFADAFNCTTSTSPWFVESGSLRGSAQDAAGVTFTAVRFAGITSNTPVTE